MNQLNQYSVHLCSFYFDANISNSSVDSRSCEKRMIITAFAAIGTNILSNNRIRRVENR